MMMILRRIERCIDIFLIILFINFIFLFFRCHFSSKSLLSTDTLQYVQETGNSDIQFKFKGIPSSGQVRTLCLRILLTTSFNSFCLHSNYILYFLPWLLELSIQFDNDIYVITTLKHLVLFIYFTTLSSSCYSSLG